MSGQLSDILSHLCIAQSAVDVTAATTVERFYRVQEPPQTLDNRLDTSESTDALKRDLIAISYSPICSLDANLSQAFDDRLVDVASACSTSGSQLLLLHPETSAALVAAVAACHEISQVIEVRVYEYHVNTAGLESHNISSVPESSFPPLCSADSSVIEGAIVSSLHGSTRDLLGMDSKICKLFVGSFGKVVNGVIQYAVGITWNNFLLIALDPSLLPAIASELRESISHLLTYASKYNGPNKVKALMTGPLVAGLSNLLEESGFIRSAHFLSLSVAPLPCSRCPESPGNMGSLKLSDIYLLAGQSNMSGRGPLEEGGSAETARYLASLQGETDQCCESNWLGADNADGSVRDSIYSFDPIDGWVNNR
jgi:hypothetical protein